MFKVIDFTSNSSCSMIQHMKYHEILQNSRKSLPNYFIIFLETETSETTHATCFHLHLCIIFSLRWT